MGTSKSNIGPKGISSPIPPWSDKESDNMEHTSNIDSQDDQEELQPWGDVKRSYSAFIKTPTFEVYKKLTGKYRKANGGNKTLAKSALGGKKGIRKLLNFLTAVAEKGFVETCKEFLIGDLTGVSTEEAIYKLCNIFDDIDGTDEGSAAKAAVTETMYKLYDNYSGSPEDIDKMTTEEISEYLNLFISNYIFERLSIEVTKALEDNKFTKAQVIKANDTLKDFIHGEVRLTFTDADFATLNFQQQNATINEILTLAYSMI